MQQRIFLQFIMHFSLQAKMDSGRRSNQKRYHNDENRRTPLQVSTNFPFAQEVNVLQ